MEKDRTGTSWAGLASAGLGVWLIGSMLLFPMASGVHPSAAHMWNALITGVLIIAVGFWGMSSSSTTPYWCEFVLGLWAFAAPMILHVEDFNEGWHAMAVGVLLCVVGLCGALARTAILRQRGTPM